jgi:hypothetical protein
MCIFLIYEVQIENNEYCDMLIDVISEEVVEK